MRGAKNRKRGLLFVRTVIGYFGREPPHPFPILHKRVDSGQSFRAFFLDLH